jgi:alkylresorcinol/alkylpyrone synthase
MRISGVATAFPKYCYSQREVAEALKSQWEDKVPNPGILTRMMASVGVDRRHFVLPLDGYLPMDTWGKANNEWIQAAVELGECALLRAVGSAGLGLENIGAIFFVSVTGVASPSIEARLINRMKLPLNVKRIPIFGLGCVAGAAGIARAADYVRGFPDQAAALISVELCSLTWQRDDLSMANLISSALFGDGAAAVIVSGEKLNGSHDSQGLGSDGRGPEVLGSCSSFYPNTEDVMGWDISEKGFRIVLAPSVPDMVFQHLADDVGRFLESHGLTKADIHSWIMHTGGPKVLNATAEALQLPKGALDASWEALRNVGNLSSASVLVVLDSYMRERRPPAGSYSILAAMGPGFCAELVLLRW